MRNRPATLTGLRGGFQKPSNNYISQTATALDDPSGQNEDNDEVHNILKSWPDPTVESGEMAVGAPPLLIFSL